MAKVQSIYQKLLELRKTILYLQNDTQGYNYTYTSGTTLMSQIRPKMDELGLLLLTSVRNQKMETINYEKFKEYKGQRQTEFVREYLCTGEMEYTWINVDEPSETHTTVLMGAGSDNQDPAKAIGKMMTYFERYNLLKTFQIATDKDDPDAFQTKAEIVQQKSTTKTKSQAKKNQPPQEQQPTEQEIADKIEEEKIFYLASIDGLIKELGNIGADMQIDFEGKVNKPLSQMDLKLLKRVFALMKEQQVKLAKGKGKKEETA